MICLWEAVDVTAQATRPSVPVQIPLLCAPSYIGWKTLRVDLLDEDHGVPDIDIWKRTKDNAKQRRAKVLFKSNEIISTNLSNVSLGPSRFSRINEQSNYSHYFMEIQERRKRSAASSWLVEPKSAQADTTVKKAGSSPPKEPQ